MTENEMVGWHHRFDGHESERNLGDGDGQGSLACCSPWGCEESDMTERLNWTEEGRKRKGGRQRALIGNSREENRVQPLKE